MYYSICYFRILTEKTAKLICYAAEKGYGKPMNELHFYNLEDKNLTLYSTIQDSVENFTERELRSHTVYLLTCYIDLKATKKIIYDLAKKIRITNVKLHFNFSEYYKYKPNDNGSLKEKLHQLKNNLKKKKIILDILPITLSNSLPHAKAYCVTQNDKKNDSIRDCILVTTSSNLTSSGIGINTTRNNFEIGFSTNAKIHTRKFIKYLKLLETSESNRVFKSKLFFKYLLLSNSIYFYKWQTTISQELQVRFKINEKNKKEIMKFDAELTEKGFLPDGQKTLTKNHFDLSKQPISPLPSNFKKHFCIETYLGNWCPSPVWKYIEKNIFINEFNVFQKWINDLTTNENIEQIKIKIQNDEEYLLEKGYIVKEKDKIENWFKKIKNLKFDTERLKRVYFQYEMFSLPYPPTDEDGINKLFKSLHETIKIKKSKSFIIRKTEESIRKENIEKLELSENDIEDIIKLAKINT